MSRIGKKPIVLPERTEIESAGGIVTVRGPLGEIKKTFHPNIEVRIEGREATIVPKKENLETRALWGTFAAHLANMVSGVNKVFEKKLILEGIGFKSEVKASKIIFALGFSHPVEIEIPQGLKVTAEKNLISISGVDKELVGSFAAQLRALRKPEPYKGKGMRYEDEIIKRKQGKKSV